MQPQLLVRPDLMLPQWVTVSFPQSQAHSHDEFFSPILARLRMVSRPNRLPIKSGVFMPVVSSVSDRFAICLPIILKHEGGWSDHPKDPGGATQKGVTLAVFSDFLGRKATKDDLRAITNEQLSTIYRRGFWFPSHCDKLPAGVDLIVFDLAVNSGPGRARRFLQEAVGAEPDGVIGAKTLAAVAALPPREVILRLRNRREKFYKGLNTFGTFGKGWMRRLSEVAVAADRMAK